MDITASMMATVRGRAPFPLAHFCNDSVAASDWKGGCTPTKQQMLRQNYAAKIERLDGLLGKYLALIQEQGEGNNTIVCLASDHGEMLGDRATHSKSKPWQSAMSVPLICSGPDILKGKIVHTPVTTMDLAATFIDYSGASTSESPGMTSRSLRPLLEGGQAAQPLRSVVHSGLGNFRTVIVHNASTGHALKLFCCNDHGCPGSTPADRALMESVRRTHPHTHVTSEVHLFNFTPGSWDRFESPAADLAVARPDLVKDMAALLPGWHPTQPSYNWRGCNLAGWVPGAVPPTPPPLPPVPPLPANSFQGCFVDTNPCGSSAWCDPVYLDP